MCVCKVMEEARLADALYVLAFIDARMTAIQQGAHTSVGVQDGGKTVSL